MPKRSTAAILSTEQQATPTAREVDHFASDIRAAASRVIALREGWERSQHTAQPFDFASIYLELSAAMEELRVAEEDLRQQNEELAVARELIEIERHRYQELFDLAPDAYIITDEDALVGECNIAASTLFGVSREFLVAKPLPSFIDVEVRREFRAQVENVKRSGRTLHWRSELRGPEGRTLPIAISAAPIRVGPRVSGLRWLIRDDSIQEAAQSRLFQLSEELATRASERDAQMQLAARHGQDATARDRQRTTEGGYSYAELLATVSHELRTPLAAAHGYIELLRRGMRGGLTPTQRSDIESIAICHEHLLRVLDNALAGARLDGGHLDLALEHVALDDALQGLQAYVAPDFEAKGIEYVCEAGDPSVAVLADRSKLRQIMLNLLTNAVKYTPSGGSVTVTWTAGDGSVDIAVTDTGIGIAPDDQERVFEPYVRIARGEPGDRGAGLGLAISRKLARAMGGDVTVVSTAEAGSNFTLTLPRAGRAPR